jgi:ribosomal-protein-alanine N-acetyltransferase
MNSIKWKIREMTKEDLDEVIEIERLSFPSPWSRSLFIQELQSPISRCWVAEAPRGMLKGDLAGYMCVWIAAREMHIMNLATHPQIRRMGVAKALLTHALYEASNCGTEKVVLEVRQSNFAAKNLYKSFGFRAGGIRKHYYGDTGEDALVMILSLRG